MQEKIIATMISDNNWMPYMDFKNCFIELVKQNMIVNMAPKAKEPRYGITIESREGLTYYYSSIPISLRESISSHIKENRIYYRKKQEYVADYEKNADGTYTVTLKIEYADYVLMDLKLIVTNRNKAKWIYNNWGDQASNVYEAIQGILIDN